MLPRLKMETKIPFHRKLSLFPLLSPLTSTFPLIGKVLIFTPLSQTEQTEIKVLSSLPIFCVFGVHAFLHCIIRSMSSSSCRRRHRSWIRGGGDDDNDLISLVAQLPEVVLFKVLSWLPVKSLLRFRCLSKQWLDVISNDCHFIQLHSQQSKSKPPILFFSSSPDLEVENNTIYVQSSIDMEGRLLSKFELRKTDDWCPFVLPTRFDLVCFKAGDLLHVCNPSTKEFIVLPPLSYSDFHMFGFGYVESTDEYKVLQLIPPFLDGGDYENYNINEDPHDRTECLVFTLGMTEDSPSSYASPWAWRHIGNSPYHIENSAYHVECNQRPAFTGGALHWIISRYRHRELMTDTEQTLILAFDLASEEFRLVPRPVGCDLDLIANLAVDLQLVELRELLCLSILTQLKKMDIWTLKDYDNKNRIFTWVKEYSIDLSTLGDPYRCCFYVPRDIQDDGNKVLIENWDGELFYYHRKKTTSFSGFIRKQGASSFFSFYGESLRSLRHVLQRRFKFDQIIGDTNSQSECLAELDPPIYIGRVIAISCLPDEDDLVYGGYITDLRGHFVAIEGKLLLEAGDIIEADAEAILCGLQLARSQGIKRIGLVSNAKEIVDAIITGERQKFQRLDKILALITDLLSQFTWAQIFHDRRMSTQVAIQIAWQASSCMTLFFNEPPEWFVDG